jgi:hypothetical protein
MKVAGMFAGAAVTPDLGAIDLGQATPHYGPRNATTIR